MSVNTYLIPHSGGSQVVVFIVGWGWVCMIVEGPSLENAVENVVMAKDDPITTGVGNMAKEICKMFMAIK